MAFKALPSVATPAFLALPPAPPPGLSLCSGHTSPLAAPQSAPKLSPTPGLAPAFPSVLNCSHLCVTYPFLWASATLRNLPRPRNQNAPPSSPRPQQAVSMSTKLFLPHLALIYRMRSQRQGVLMISFFLRRRSN